MILSFQANSRAQVDRIAQPIDDGERFTTRGTLHPLAGSKYDKGRADASVQLERLMLVLKPSAAQASELDSFLAEVHDPKSGNYHKWLTPESFADRFGLSQADIDKVVTWLSANELTVKSVARAQCHPRERGRGTDVLIEAVDPLVVQGLMSKMVAKSSGARSQLHNTQTSTEPRT